MLHSQSRIQGFQFSHTMLRSYVQVFNHIRVTSIKKTSVGKDVEKRTLVHCWWECEMVQPLWKKVQRFLKKLKSRTRSTTPLVIIKSDISSILHIHDNPIYPWSGRNFLAPCQGLFHGNKINDCGNLFCFVTDKEYGRRRKVNHSHQHSKKHPLFDASGTSGHVLHQDRVQRSCFGILHTQRGSANSLSLNSTKIH